MGSVDGRTVYSITLGGIAMNIQHQRWAISREWLPKLTAFYKNASIERLLELGPKAGQVRADRMTAAEQFAKTTPGRTAVVQIRGVIEYDPFWWGCSCQEISLILDVLADRSDVERIVFNINSPGGESHGVMELANKIYGMRSKIETVAIANCMACSAGHWLGSAAEKFYAMGSGDVGSVGVYMMHVDQSGLLEKEGVKVSFVQAGLYKTEGNPYAPLDDTARAHLQARVSEDYSQFVGFLAKSRGKSTDYVEANFGQGKVVSPSEALAVGMIDGFATLEGLMNAQTKKSVPGRMAVLADQMKREAKIRKSEFDLALLK